MFEKNGQQIPRRDTTFGVIAENDLAVVSTVDRKISVVRFRQLYTKTLCMDYFFPHAGHWDKVDFLPWEEFEHQTMRVDVIGKLGPIDWGAFVAQYINSYLIQKAESKIACHLAMP